MTMARYGRIAFLVYLVCTLTAMAPMSLGFVVLFSAWLLPLIHGRFQLRTLYGTPTAEFNRYRFFAWTLLIACWTSLSFAGIFPKTYAGQAPEVTLHGYLKIWYLIIPGMMVAVHTSASKEKPLSWSTILKPWWIMTVILFAVAVVQFFTGWPLSQPIPTNPGRFHAILFFGHHLSTASIIIFPAFAALSIALGSWIRKDRSLADLDIPSKLAWIAALSGILILFLSYARTAWLTLLIGLAITVLHHLGKKLTRKQMLVGFTSVVLSLFAFSQTAAVKERITNLMGVEERFQLWKVNVEFFKDRPLLGIGWLKTQEMTRHYYDEVDPLRLKGNFGGHAHSNFFEMLGGTGLIGLMAFLAWSWFTLSLANRLRKRFLESGDPVLADLCFGILIALVLLHVNGLTNVNFWEGKVMHQQMLALGFLLILDRESASRNAFVRR